MSQAFSARDKLGGHTVKATKSLCLAGGGNADGEVGFSWDFQPVLPLHLNEKWNLIGRAVMNYKNGELETCASTREC